MLLFRKVYEGTAFEGQKLHTVDNPDPAREEGNDSLTLWFSPEPQTVKYLCLLVKQICHHDLSHQVVQVAHPDWIKLPVERKTLNFADFLPSKDSAELDRKQ